MGYKILIIDDDEKLCKAILRFNKRCFDVDYLLSAEEVKQQLIDNKYDLIIFDLEIGDTDGYQVYEQTRYLHNTPVVFLSGNSTVEVRIKSLQSGVEDFIVKPIDLKELQVKILMILNRSEKNAKIQKIGMYTVDNNQYKIYMGDKQLKLTPAATRLFMYLLHNPNVELSREFLLKEIWSYKTDAGNRLIDTNINTIRSETFDSNIKTIRGIGYKYEIPE